MNKITAFSLLFIALTAGACTTVNSEENFGDFTVKAGAPPCELTSDGVTQNINYEGVAYGKQTLKIKTYVFSDNDESEDDAIASLTREIDVKDDFSGTLDVTLPVSKDEWDEGYNQCAISIID